MNAMTRRLISWFSGSCARRLQFINYHSDFFLTGSRPESHIRASFDQESQYTITHRVVHDKPFNPGRDIQVIISAENSILSNVEQLWLSEGIIDILVQWSSGQFVYLATVLKFVSSAFCIPTKQLALVLKSDPKAFSDLTNCVYPNPIRLSKRSEHRQSFGSVSHGYLAEVIDDIFGIEDGELKLVLRGLSSLMKDGNGSVWIKGSSYMSSLTSYMLHLVIICSNQVVRVHPRQSTGIWKPGYYTELCSHYANDSVLEVSNLMIFSLLIIHDHERMSSITRVLHIATWGNFVTTHLPYHLRHSPRVLKEVIIMT